MASQISSLTIVYSTVYSGADQRKHQSSASLAFVQGIHLWPANSPHKWPVTRKMFPFDDFIMALCLMDFHGMAHRWYLYSMISQSHLKMFRIAIWHSNSTAASQQCYPGPYQITKRYDDFNYQSRSYERSRDLMIRHLIGYWKGLGDTPSPTRVLTGLVVTWRESVGIPCPTLTHIIHRCVVHISVCHKRTR